MYAQNTGTTFRQWIWNRARFLFVFVLSFSLFSCKILITWKQKHALSSSLAENWMTCVDDFFWELSVSHKKPLTFTSRRFCVNLCVTCPLFGLSWLFYRKVRWCVACITNTRIFYFFVVALACFLSLSKSHCIRPPISTRQSFNFWNLLVERRWLL